MFCWPVKLITEIYAMVTMDRQTDRQDWGHGMGMIGQWFVGWVCTVQREQENSNLCFDVLALTIYIAVVTHRTC